MRILAYMNRRDNAHDDLVGPWQGENVGKQPHDLNLSDRQKTRLLSIALNTDDQETSPSGEEKRGDLLCDILRRPLPNRGFGFDGRSPGTCTSDLTLPSVCGPPIRELLGASDTDVSVLRRIKEYAKKAGAHVESEVEKDVFLAVYFAAIAAALAFRGERITEHADENLAHFFADFAVAGWMTTDLAGLFDRAVPCCQEAKKADGNCAE